MADFNKPNRDQEYVNALPDTRDNQEALAKMFNGVSALNIPINSVQFAGGVFSLWDGGNWNAQAVSVSGGGTGSTTAAGARTNLGVISESDSDNKYLKQASNLADLDDKSIARAELQALGITNNLSDVNDAATAFDNIKQPATETSIGAIEKSTLPELSSGAADKYPDAATIQAYFKGYEEIVLNAPVGDFTSGDVKIVRIGDIVTITGYFTHASDSIVTSGASFIPSWARPAFITTNTFLSGNSVISQVSITDGGSVQVLYRNYSGTLTNQTATEEFTISYVLR